MSMLDILKKLDNIEKKSLKESVVTECPGDMATGASGPVSVNITANDAGQMAAILKALSGIESSTPKIAMTATPMDNPMIPGQDDVDGDSDTKDGIIGTAAGGALGALAGGPIGAGIGAVAGDKLTGEEEVEEWDNEPSEEYRDHKFMTKDLSGGINRQKKMFPPAAKGDNPMAVSEKQADPEVIKRVQQLTNVTDINTLKQEILDILNTAKINPKTKPSLLQNIKNSKTRQNLLGLAWNTFVLGREGQHAITSNWRSRHGITDDIQAEGWKSPSEGEYYDDERDISIRWSADDDGIHIEAYDSEENMVRLSPREENHYEELIRQEMEDDHNEYGDWKYRQSIGDSIKFESIKDRLYKALNEKKSKPDFLDADKDGNKKEPMKKAIKDKKKDH